MKRTVRISVAAAAVLLCAAAHADPASRPLVVELFTAQGCSDCPPAEASLGELSARPDVLALAFHVGYFDSLGWPDRFALRQCDERQLKYARNFHRSSLYTPQFVIDGRTDSVSSERFQQLLGELRDAIPASLSVRDAQLLVDLGGRSGLPDSDVLLVAYRHHEVSAIGRGENAGRTLEEFNIVRGIRSLGTFKGAAQSFHIPLSSLPPDATDAAVLVQQRGQGRIVGAAAQSLR